MAPAPCRLRLFAIALLAGACALPHEAVWPVAWPQEPGRPEQAKQKAARRSGNGSDQSAHDPNDNRSRSSSIGQGIAEAAPERHPYALPGEGYLGSFPGTCRPTMWRCGPASASTGCAATACRISFEPDYGAPGDAHRLHGRATIGVIWIGLELQVGYDHEATDSVDLPTWTIGLRRWL